MCKDLATSVMYAFEYLIGLVVFGLMYWLLNGILVEFRVFSIQDSVYYFCNYMWGAAIFVYLIVGIFYLIRRIKTWTVMK